MPSPLSVLVDRITTHRTVHRSSCRKQTGQVRCCCSPAPGHCVEMFENQKMALKTENATRAKPLHFKALYIELIVTYLYLYTPELSSVYF